MDNVRKLLYVIPASFSGKYLKDFLTYQGYSQELIKHLKKTLDLDMFHILSNGEEVRIDIIEDEKSDIEPNPNLKYEILYEDDDMLVINKPADMPIHPSQGNHNNTLGNAVIAHMGEKNFVYRPITRLDRDTSGVCLIAKNRLSASVFQAMIQRNLIRRSYLGLVKGNIYKALFMHSKVNELANIEDIVNLDMIIDVPIKRADDSTILRVAAKDGEKAITKLFALKYDKVRDISLCKFLLLTGLTHQIRVHMKHLGFPIIGDFLYNPDYEYISRQALHSNEIILAHPLKRNLLRIESKLPNDMRRLMN